MVQAWQILARANDGSTSKCARKFHIYTGTLFRGHHQSKPQNPKKREPFTVTPVTRAKDAAPSAPHCLIVVVGHQLEGPLTVEPRPVPDMKQKVEHRNIPASSAPRSC